MHIIITVGGILTHKQPTIIPKAHITTILLPHRDTLKAAIIHIPLPLLHPDAHQIATREGHIALEQLPVMMFIAIPQEPEQPIATYQDLLAHTAVPLRQPPIGIILLPHRDTLKAHIITIPHPHRDTLKAHTHRRVHLILMLVVRIASEVLVATTYIATLQEQEQPLATTQALHVHTANNSCSSDAKQKIQHLLNKKLGIYSGEI